MKRRPAVFTRVHGWCAELMVSRLRVFRVVAGSLLRRRLPLRAGISFESFGSQGEMYHGSHCVHIRCPVVVICGGLSSQQARQVFLARPCAQDLPLFAPPDIMKDEVLSRFDRFTAFAEIRFHCFDVVQVPVQWCHPCAELREDARMSFAELVVHAPSVAARPPSIDSAHCVSDLCRRLRSRSRKDLL